MASKFADFTATVPAQRAKTDRVSEIMSTATIAWSRVIQLSSVQQQIRLILVRQPPAQLVCNKRHPKEQAMLVNVAGGKRHNTTKQ